MTNIRIIITGILSIFSCLSLQAQAEIKVTPYPNHIELGKGIFNLTPDAKIITSEECASVASYFNQELDNRLEIVKDASKADATILFKKVVALSDEEYILDIKTNTIEITASDSKGWFYGVQSLLQLFSMNEIIDRKDWSVNVPQLIIKDKPRFAWRAFMLDEARHFKGKKQVKLLLDEMARLKMNVFHWHLVDDEGWRIEIKKYPLLTEVGSVRRSTQINYNKLRLHSPVQSGEVHSGFYTQEEIKEIIEYAAERHITIVPEIEMPGHSSSAIAAYPYLGTKKKEIEVPITFFARKDLYDISDPKVYEFLTDVLDEVMTLFPSKVIHIGGDEAMQKYWKESDKVQAYMKENNLKTTGELQTFFINRISQYLQAKGRRMMGWNEILGHNIHDYLEDTDTRSDIELASNSLIHFWRGDLDLLVQAAENGYNIVNSLYSATYLDYDYSATPLSKAYEFDPIPNGLDKKYHDNVVGIGCQMWSEWIPTVGQMHFMVFPRIAAYAETGWSMPHNKNFEGFKIRLNQLQNVWKRKKIYYATEEGMQEQGIKLW